MNESIILESLLQKKKRTKKIEIMNVLFKFNLLEGEHNEHTQPRFLNYPPVALKF